MGENVHFSINEKIEHIIFDEESWDYDELFVADNVSELKHFLNRTNWEEFRVVDSSGYDGNYYIGNARNYIHADILSKASDNGWFPNHNKMSVHSLHSDIDFIYIIRGKDNDAGMFGCDDYCVKYVFEDYTILTRDNSKDDKDIIKKFGNLIDRVSLLEPSDNDILDSQGNELTIEQMEFFKSSVIRDTSGKLLVCYHNTNAEFDIFDKERIRTGTFGNGFYFTTDKRSADSYGGKFTNAYYLNAKKVAVVPEDYEDIHEYLIAEFGGDDISLLFDAGYDAISTPMYWNDDMFEYYVVFGPNQIKRISNKMPTNSDNLNESMSNSISIDVAEAEEIATQFVSPTPTYQTWIDTQGRFLDASKLGSHYNMVDEVFWQLSDKGEFNDVKPIDLDPLDYNAMTDKIFDSFLNIGWIQIGLDCNFVGIHLKPTREQYDSIEKYLDYSFEEGEYSMSVSVHSNPFQYASYNLKEVTPEYVVGRIKRCFSSGTLYEAVDSTGKQLTAEQETFFANSKVRDDKGNLMVCYHGTENTGFTEFKPQNGKSQFGKYKFNTHNVNYFTSDFETAKSYTLIGIGDTDGEHKNIYACYVNITNPYIVDNQTDVDIKSFQNIKDKKIRDVQVRTFDRIFRKWSRWFPDASDLDDINRDMHTLNFEFRPTDESEEYFDLYTLGKNTAFGSEHQEMFDYTLEEYFSEDCYEEFRDAVVGNYEEEYDDYYLTIDDIIKFVLLMNEEEGTNYDGIIVSDIYDVGPRGSIWSAIPATDIITLKSSNQIKRITNSAPTDKGSIDEDLGDNSMNFSSALEADIKRSLNNVYKDRDKYETQEDLEDAMYWAINDCLRDLQFISKSKSEVIEDIIAMELKEREKTIEESVDTAPFKFRLVEEFVNTMVPGERYFFRSKGGIRSGYYKGSTKTWHIFTDGDGGNDHYVNLWSNIATSKEDLEMLDGVVDKMEKDTKVPKTMHLPNRFI